MRTLKVTLAYDGTKFRGWQIQPVGRTIEGEIRKALEFMHKHPVNILAAGRTDSGVHASGQVISYQSELDSIALERYPRALNNFLPKDIRVQAVEEVTSDFHARFDARLRTYKYYLFPSELPDPTVELYSLRIVHKPDIRVLNRMASKFIGTHDFTTFSSPNEQIPDRVRTIHAASFHAEGHFLVFSISAGSFLWKMVRSIVGSLLEFEQDALMPEEVSLRLEAKDRKLAGTTAPAWGLFLHKVVYKDERILF